MATLKLTQSNIGDASTKELLAFGRDEAGLEFEPGAGREYIIREIYSALEWDAYKPEDGATHVVIKLPITKDERHPYQGGYQGRMFTIKRGMDVEITIGQYNTMVDAATHRYRLMPVPPDGNITEGSPASNRVPMGALEMQVIRFINKGSKKAADKAPAEKPVDAEVATAA